MNIQDNVAVVSGGGSGIGKATVLSLAERGAKVIVADINDASGQETVERVREQGGIASFVHCDVTQTDDLEAVFAAAIEHCHDLNIVFNNAGIGGGSLFTDDTGAWQRIIGIDLTAVIDATRLAVKYMQARQGGVIINTASEIGLYPMPQAPVYAAAKAGVVNFSRSLAYLHEEQNIRVNAICPELVDTAMTRAALGEDTMSELAVSGKVLLPEAIAQAVVELVADETKAGAIMSITLKEGQRYVL